MSLLGTLPGVSDASLVSSESSGAVVGEFTLRHFQRFMHLPDASLARTSRLLLGNPSRAILKA